MRRRFRDVEFGFRLPAAVRDASAWHPDIPARSSVPEPCRRGEPRLVVVVHVYYRELLPDLLILLDRLEEDFVLLVTNASGAPLDLGPIPRHVTRAEVLEVQNRGRDIFPLTQVLNAGLLDGFELILKVHTKKSAWRDEYARKTQAGKLSAGLSGGGDQWRDELLDAIIGDAALVRTITRLFDTDPSIGLVTAKSSLLGPEFWGYNMELSRALCRRSGTPFEERALLFPAGSMYWARVSAIVPLRRLQLAARDFSDERGQTDGTTAHAVERVLGLLVRGENLRMLGV